MVAISISIVLYVVISQRKYMYAIEVATACVAPNYCYGAYTSLHGLRHRGMTALGMVT